VEAQQFAAKAKDLADRNTVVVGISPDDIDAQSKFKAKYKLPFTLLADVDHRAAEAYGVWKEKSMYGRKYMGIERSTFLIGKDSSIQKVYLKVKPDGHADEVLGDVEKLERAG
jgi:thioredoxin-dependent peroxiredoxin